MRLKTLHIELEMHGYSRPKGTYYGEVEFVSPTGTIKLPFSKNLSDKILTACADSLVEASREISRDLTAECINAALPPDERTPKLSDLKREL